MRVRYGQFWDRSTHDFSSELVSVDEAWELFETEGFVSVEVTDGDRTTIVYAFSAGSGTTAWYESRTLVQEHALSRSAHGEHDLLVDDINEHHDGGARVVAWEVFPSYGVASRQVRHYPAGEHDERTWHTLTAADLDLLSVPGPIDPRDVNALIEPSLLGVTQRLDALPQAEFGPLPATWEPVPAPGVPTYGARRVGESNALWGFITAREAEQRHVSGEPWCLDLQPAWPGTASSPRITVDVTGDKIFVDLRHGQHSIRRIGFVRTGEAARLGSARETRWDDTVRSRPPLWVTLRDPHSSRSLDLPTNGEAEIRRTVRGTLVESTAIPTRPPRLYDAATVEDVAALALEAQHLTIDELLED
ncbi:hypothetical protein BJF80_02935 [Serinicoccus sp. CUA-874]|uniref:hypothetical protein n=1 Tax=Serinicoccus sp. CUA-874 TaxID=1517939 RepID=UPI000963D3D7|nr:hypothetical protein [Serinicoccus sp. CUA-874]OLT17155.1 hypothetical protein BJF80_02935 [Serinicoccus sp. CUA-874]